MKTLRQCLMDCDMAMLRAIAEQRGIELTTNRQREVVEQLAEELLQPESTSDVLETLKPQEREALESLKEGGTSSTYLPANTARFEPLGLAAWNASDPGRIPSAPPKGSGTQGSSTGPSMTWKARPASSSSYLKTCCPSCVELRKHHQPSL
jgi:hypothetical protein